MSGSERKDESFTSAQGARHSSFSPSLYPASASSSRLSPSMLALSPWRQRSPESRRLSRSTSPHHSANTSHDRLRSPTSVLVSPIQQWSLARFPSQSPASTPSSSFAARLRAPSPFLAGAGKARRSHSPESTTLQGALFWCQCKCLYRHLSIYHNVTLWTCQLSSHIACAPDCCLCTCHYFLTDDRKSARAWFSPIPAASEHTPSPRQRTPPRTASPPSPHSRCFPQSGGGNSPDQVASGAMQCAGASSFASPRLPSPHTREPKSHANTEIALVRSNAERGAMVGKQQHANDKTDDVEVGGHREGEGKSGIPWNVTLEEPSSPRSGALANFGRSSGESVSTSSESKIYSGNKHTTSRPHADDGRVGVALGEGSSSKDNADGRAWESCHGSIAWNSWLERSGGERRPSRGGGQVTFGAFEDETSAGSSREEMATSFDGSHSGLSRQSATAADVQASWAGAMGAYNTWRRPTFEDATASPLHSSSPMSPYSPARVHNTQKSIHDLLSPTLSLSLSAGHDGTSPKLPLPLPPTPSLSLSHMCLSSLSHPPSLSFALSFCMCSQRCTHGCLQFDSMAVHSITVVIVATSAVADDDDNTTATASAAASASSLDMAMITMRIISEPSHITARDQNINCGVAVAGRASRTWSSPGPRSWARSPSPQTMVFRVRES